MTKCSKASAYRPEVVLTDLGEAGLSFYKFNFMSAQYRFHSKAEIGDWRVCDDTLGRETLVCLNEVA